VWLLGTPGLLRSPVGTWIYDFDRAVSQTTSWQMDKAQEGAERLGQLSGH
jgi:hypothetical protein